MAQLHPPLSQFHPTTSGAYRERDVLKILADGLPDSFDVFHGVDWATVHENQQSFGELDAVVVSASGHVVVLEVKAGSLEMVGNTLQKLYSGTGGCIENKDVGQQARRQHGAMIGRLAEEGLSAVRVAHLLVLPDHTVEVGTAAYPRERTVDATEMEALCTRVKMALPNSGSLSAGLPTAIRNQVLNFFADRFQLQPDAGMHIGQVQQTNISLADGLATWVPRISHSSGIFMVEATAGSGKSQLALALLRDAAKRGMRGAYFCYNRPLADHMVGLAPNLAEVSTFHEFCTESSRRAGVEPDFTVREVFQQMVDRLVAHAEMQLPTLDLLIVDESQDFEPIWVQALLPRLKDGSRLYVLGDAQQNLYGRDTFDLSDAVHIQCNDNFRSPRAVVNAINQLRLTSAPLKPRSVFQGQTPGFHTYLPGAKGCLAALGTCLRALLKDGHKPEHIVVLTFAGRERSAVLSQTELAGMQTKRFDGTYDKAGNPNWTEGTLMVETLYRFKGQSAPVVVLCEVDFEEPSDRELRKLFVGFTRAQFQLECVISERAAGILMER